MPKWAIPVGWFVLGGWVPLDWLSTKLDWVSVWVLSKHPACKLIPNSQGRSHLQLRFIFSVLSALEWWGHWERIQNFTKELESPIDFTRLSGHTKNKRWRRCCVRGACSMEQSHSTYCNSCGYYLISLAAVLWQHTAALRRPSRAAALGRHTAALQHLKASCGCLRGTETVTVSCCMYHTKRVSAQLCASDQE